MFRKKTNDNKNAIKDDGRCYSRRIGPTSKMCTKNKNKTERTRTRARRMPSFDVRDKDTFRLRINDA